MWSSIVSAVLSTAWCKERLSSASITSFLPVGTERLELSLICLKFLTWSTLWRKSSLLVKKAKLNSPCWKEAFKCSQTMRNSEKIKTKKEKKKRIRFLKGKKHEATPREKKKIMTSGQHDFPNLVDPLVYYAWWNYHLTVRISVLPKDNTTKYPHNRAPYKMFYWFSVDSCRW